MRRGREARRGKRRQKTLDEDHSLDEEPLSKKVKVAEVVTEDMPPPVAESIEGEMQQPGEVAEAAGGEVAEGEVEDRVEGEVEQPWLAEGLGQGAREARPDEAALVLALRELTKVCRQGFNDM